MKAIFILSLYLFSTSLFAQSDVETDSVTWVKEHFAPLYISKGEYSNVGTADNILKILTETMEGYQHKTTYLPIKRIITRLKSGEKIACISFLKDTTLLDFAQYSDPVFILPPQELIMTRTLWDILGNPASVSIVELMSKNKKLGIADGRHYGTVLNKFIKKQLDKNASSIFVRTGDHFAGLAKMLSIGRIDFTLGYSGELLYFLETVSKEALVSIPIEEHTELQYVYAVMPKTEWGDQLREDLNQTLHALHESKKFKVAITNWFTATEALDKAISALKKN